MARQQEVELLETISSEIFSETVEPVEIYGKIDTDKKLLNIMHLNIRSVKKNFDELLLFLETFKISFCDVIVLSECFQLTSFLEFTIQGYTTHYSNGNITRNDGVLIMVRDNLNAKLTFHELDSTKIKVGRITLEHKNVHYEISCIYRSPQSSIETFVQDLNVYFTENKSNNVEILIGDININLLNNTDLNVVNYISTLSSYGFQSHINSITRSESGTCLDHIFVKNNNKLSNVYTKPYILNYDITDHFPIMLNFSHATNIKRTENNVRAVVKNKINYIKLNYLFENEKWNDVFETNNPEEAYTLFINKFSELYLKCKTTSISYNKINKKIKPWITNGIIISIKKRDRLKKQLQNNFTEEKEREYKRYRNNLKKVIDYTKNLYYKTKIDENKNNLKKIYEILSEYNNQYKKQNKIPITIPMENNNNCNLKEKANFCNDYFSKIGLDMYNQIPNLSNIFQMKNACNSMFLRPVDHNTLIKHINSLKNNSAPGHDGISAELIKKLHIYLIEPLKYIINLIFKTGIIPKSFKSSIITPVFKSGDKSLINNYRPISTISNFAKLFEKCLKERLAGFLDKNGLLSENQFGFSPGLSTADAMHKLIEHVRSKLDSGKRCLAVFLDLAKAFDTVPHRQLLDVLEKNGVRGPVLQVFTNYLVERQQYVKIDDTLSDPCTVKIGIPQGTVLGPLLFILYINSLTTLNINGIIISYADDTVIAFDGDTWEEVKKCAQNGIMLVKKWLDIYKLTLNVQKTNYIAFSKTKTNRPFFTHLDIQNLPDKIHEASNVKYLGIFIDSNLKWDLHTAHLTKKLNFLIYKFYTIRNILDRSVLITIYQSLVESILRYGILLWGSMYYNSLNPLQKMQNKILKIILKKPFLYPTQGIYNETYINIRTLFYITVCCFIHNRETIRYPINHNQNTRSNEDNQLILPVCYSEFGKRSIKFIGPKLYNLLPRHIRNIKSKRFSKIVKLYIVNNLNKFNSVVK